MSLQIGLLIHVDFSQSSKQISILVRMGSCERTKNKSQESTHSIYYTSWQGIILTTCFTMLTSQNLLELSNYNSLMAVFLALSLPAIARLQKTWKEVPKSSITIWKTIQKAMSPISNFGQYREALSSRDPSQPMVPCQGTSPKQWSRLSHCLEIILKDLLLLTESMPDWEDKPNRVINMKKLETMGKVLDATKQTQLIKFNLRTETKIMEILQNIPLVSPEALSEARFVLPFYPLLIYLVRKSKCWRSKEKRRKNKR